MHFTVCVREEHELALGSMAQMAAKPEVQLAVVFQPVAATLMTCTISEWQLSSKLLLLLVQGSLEQLEVQEICFPHPAQLRASSGFKPHVDILEAAGEPADCSVSSFAFCHRSNMYCSLLQDVLERLTDAHRPSTTYSMQMICRVSETVGG
jgi:hypothetical protein